MTAREHFPGYVANPHYSQDDWDDVCDSPELTEEDFARSKPLDEGAPDLAAALRQLRDAQAASAGRQVVLRLDPRVAAHFVATGEGWQDRVNEILLKAAGF